MSNRVTSEIGSRRARENLVRILFQHLKKDQFDDRLQRRRHSYSQLRAAYIDLVHTIHPDKLAAFHDDEERTRKEERQQKFVELQTAWEQYHASVREVLRDVRSRMSGDNKNDDDRTFGDDSSCAIDDANFTMFGVGCSFADTPDERDRRDKIMEQASRGWFPSASLSFSAEGKGEDGEYSQCELKVESRREDNDKMHSCLDVPRVPLIDDNMFVSEDQSKMKKDFILTKKMSLIQNIDRFRSRKR